MINIPISEDFSDPFGRLLAYDAYDVVQRAAVAKQSHVDVRCFVQVDPAVASTTMSDLAALTMTAMSLKTMDQLSRGDSRGENWTVSLGSGTATVAPQADRNHWDGLSYAFASGTNAVLSVTSPVDLDTGFGAADLVSLAFPAFPLAKLTLSSCFVDFTSNSSGDFTEGPTASVAFSSGALMTPLTSGDTEMRFSRANLAGIDLASITGVRFRLQATAAASTTPFRCMAIRLLAASWTYAPVDINTSFDRLVKPVTLTGAATATSTFPTASGTITPTDWPILLRSASPPSDSDPRPVDAHVAAVINTGSMTASNTFSLYLRDYPFDLVTQLDLDDDGSTKVTQATLNGLGHQPDYGAAQYGPRRQSDLDGLTMADLDGDTQGTLERVQDFLSASWIRVALQWGSSGATLLIHDADDVGYDTTLTLVANTYYFVLYELEDTSLRIRILGGNPNGSIDWSAVAFDSGQVIDDGLLRRRAGRIGWYAHFGDGDSFVQSLATRYLSFGEYRTAPFQSVTPVSGARLAVEATPPSELVTVVAPGPYGARLSIDTVRAPSSQGWRIDNSGQVGQGIKTNIFTVDDWNKLDVAFDVLFPDLATSRLDAYLLGSFNKQIEIDLPPITPGRWQTVAVKPTRGAAFATGQWQLVIVQTSADPATWYLDRISVAERAVRWSGRSDPTDGWIDFGQFLNDPQYSAAFANRGTSLQISGKALRSDAVITKATMQPIYAQLGRLNFDSPPASSPVAVQTHTTSARTVTFTGTSSTSSAGAPVVAWEWYFGDGTTISGPQPVHTFAAAGTYSVTLVVRDAYDHVAASTANITVT